MTRIRFCNETKRDWEIKRKPTWPTEDMERDFALRVPKATQEVKVVLDYLKRGFC
jgi:hypothetical protein